MSGGQERADRLARALVENGLQQSDNIPLSADFIVPGGWEDVPRPDPVCPWCERPGETGGVCDPCDVRQQEAPTPGVLLGAWLDLPPGVRRVLLAARHGTDPWTGRPVTIEVAWSSYDPDHGLATTRHRLHAVLCPPTSFDRR